MYVEHLTLADFRGYERAELSLRPGVNLLVGRNGMGKTNLVEAVGYLAHLSSHRAPNDLPLIRHGREQAIARAKVRRGTQSAVVEVEINAGRANRARLNQGALVRPREILGLLDSVLFAPEDLALVKGDPAARRKFLDELLVSLAPRYASVRSDFDRALKQRTALMKSARAAQRRGQRVNRDSLQVWNLHTARAAAHLVSARLRLIHRLGPLVRRSYASFTDRTKDTELVYETAVEGLTYESTVEEVAEALTALMDEKVTQEIERGMCLVGPHRDDLGLMLGGLPAKGYASHGESWSLALALKLGSYLLLQDAHGSDPVLILDDVFAELDAGRRSKLAEFVGSIEQVIVTAAVPEDIPEGLEGHTVRVERGELSHPEPARPGPAHPAEADGDDA